MDQVLFRCVFASLLTALLTTGCYEPQEGCLDLRATNFTFDADDACSDCCTYPNLRLRFVHRWGTGDAAPLLQLEDSLYTDGSGNDFRIRRVRFYVSTPTLELVDGQSLLPTTEELTVRLVDAMGDTLEQTIDDAVILVQASRAATSQLVGTVPSFAAVQALHLRIGVAPPADRAVPTSFPRGHPLNTQDGRLHFGIDSGYVAIKLELYASPTDTVARSIDIFAPAAGIELRLPVDQPAVLPDGRSATATLELDYRQLLSTADVRGPLPALITAIVEQLTNSLRLTALVAD